jgi:hypothetical protein
MRFQFVGPSACARSAHDGDGLQFEFPPNVFNLRHESLRQLGGWREGSLVNRLLADCCLSFWNESVAALPMGAPADAGRAGVPALVRFQPPLPCLLSYLFLSFFASSRVFFFPILSCVSALPFASCSMQLLSSNASDLDANVTK